MSEGQETNKLEASLSHAASSVKLQSIVLDDNHDNLCGICFTEIHPTENPRGRLNSCDHKFCSCCIKEWAKMTNVCPACKARFTRILTVTSAGNEEVTKVRKRNYKAWLEEDEEGEEEGEGGVEESLELQLERADGNIARFLSDCEAGSDDEVMPPSASSTHSRTNMVRCDVCQQYENASRIIFCDSRDCVFAVHLDCLGLSEHPLTFFCPTCAKRRRSDGGQNPNPTLKEKRMEDSTPPAPISVVTPSRTAVVPPPLLPPQRRPQALPGNAPSPRAPLPRATPRRTTPLSRPRAPVVEPPVDFSKPFPPSTQPGWGRGWEALGSALPRGRPAEDDLYFLRPNPHAMQATRDFMKLSEARRYESEVRRDRKAAQQRRVADAEGPYRGYAISPMERGGYDDLLRGSKRRREGGAVGPSLEERQRRLEAAEAELRDPARRGWILERMARRSAAGLMPVLRQKAVVAESRLRLDGAGEVRRGAPTSEQAELQREHDLWESAMGQARGMVAAELKREAASLRAQRESLVRAQAQREAAALAKLARIIASHRRPSAPQ
ncbi:unnamed protein product [Phytomonas sp. EM1]|nr:unnamed protein product [Phytomonas sp. EM1]|eukprot:CCW61007.1 unnamed protein product [Phytomonas sp. isolate EM1]